MSDPKYQPTENGLLRVEGGYMVPNDEPVMVFRGKDIGALDAICEYVEMLLDQPRNQTISSHLESSLERLEAFYLYQINNPDLQSVGCSRRSHDGAARFILRAKKLLETCVDDVVVPF